MIEEEIEKIRQEIEQLSQKKVELVKAHQHQFFLYRWFLPEHPELKFLNSQIEVLEEQERLYFKILLERALIPPRVKEKDFSEYPLYSHTLKSWNFGYPFDQLGMYVYTLAGVGIVSKALWRSWNIKKAAEIFKQGVDSAEPGKFDFHMYNSGLECEKTLGRAMASRGYRIGQAVAVAGLLVTGFATFVQLKNRNVYNQ